MANYSPNTWTTGDTITKTKMDRLEAGAAAALPSADAPELIRDTIGTALTAGSNVTITPNDTNDTITIAATGSGGSGDNVVFDAVAEYGAVSGGVDNLTAINNAINAASAAGGGTVYLRAGAYACSGAVTMKRRVRLVGAGITAEQGGTGTTIYFGGTSSNGLVGVDLRDVTIEDLSVVGPESGTGTGIKFTRSANPDTSAVTLRRVQVSSFGAVAIDISNLITSTFDRVLVDGCPVGIYLHGVLGIGGSPGTSVSLINCYAAGCSQAGYRIDNMTYTAFVGCASDNCGTAYELLEPGTQGISFVGCGFESSVNTNSTYPGYGWKISGGVAVVLTGCFSYDSANTSVWVTGNARAVNIIGFSENTPQAAVVNSIKVDAGSNATVSGIDIGKPVSFLGTVVLVNDAGGMVVPGYSYVGGAATFDGASTFNNTLKLPRYTTAARPTAASAGSGSAIFNTTTNLPNFSDGTNWRNAAGTTV